MGQPEQHHLTPAETAVLAAVDALTETYGSIAGQVADLPDPQRAFNMATALAERMRAIAEDAADVRAQQVGRIWTAEEMSLAGLAEKIGVSRQRAHKLVRAAAANAAPTEKE